uniref:Uncharacterized protein n=1 Tax=Physcomitrium patens TaxID=3218 RepID=A0A2K1IRJ7_PHYPA|nr:hypothetical protein PHYPA_026027 [Physcomitrium patens]
MPTWEISGTKLRARKHVSNVGEIGGGGGMEDLGLHRYTTGSCPRPRATSEDHRLIWMAVNLLLGTAAGNDLNQGDQLTPKFSASSVSRGECQVWCA